MPLTEEVYLPSDEELTVQEITISSPLLRASATHLGLYCDDKCKEYMLCKEEERDPRKCISEGKKVTECGVEFYLKVKASCSQELETFAKCIEWNSADMKFDYCRRDQAIYDQCMQSKLGLKKAPFGYFSQVRLHDSKRPKPAPIQPEFPNKTPGLPEDYPLQPSRQGSRNWFWP